jgi:hypothetical protein
MLRHGRSEYLVLRRTIAQRGALRPILLVAGIGIWALVLTAVVAWLPYPVAAAIPLLILAAAFEAIRPLHFGAERIGRYLQVFYEEAGDPQRPFLDTPSWERVAMSFGTVPGVGGHPLFVPVFLLATMCNYVAVIIPAPLPIEMGVMAVFHLAVIAWFVAATRAMKKQREIELARMRELAGREPRSTDNR